MCVWCACCMYAWCERAWCVCAPYIPMREWFRSIPSGSSCIVVHKVESPLRVDSLLPTTQQEGNDDDDAHITHN